MNMTSGGRHQERLPAIGTFVRPATGLVRGMGGTQALIYNTMITTLLLGAALTYLWAPYAFPGCNVALGIVCTGVFGATMMTAYSMLAATMPRSGGDYVFQSRILHPAVAFAAVGSGFMIWLMFWQALGGWMVAVMGISPLMLMLGATLGSPVLENLGRWAATPHGVVVVSLLSFCVSAAVCAVGVRAYLRLQKWLLAGIMLTFALVWALLLTTPQAEFAARFNAFMAGFSPAADYYQHVISAAREAGFAAAPVAGGAGFGGINWGATFGVMPIAWTALAWTMWSIMNAGEIKNAGRLRLQLLQTLGALALNTGLLAVTAVLLAHSMGADFLAAMGQLYYSGSEALAEFPVPPYFGVLASIAAGHPALIFFILLGFVLNGVQILIGMCLGGSRVMMAMSFDRVLPDALADVSPRLRTPLNAILAYHAGAVAWVLLYNYTAVGAFTLSVTLASMVTYMFTSLAAALLPFREREMYLASPVGRLRILGVPAITVFGIASLLFNLAITYYFLTADRLFVNDVRSEALIGAIFVLCLVYYFARRAYLKRRGINIDLAFAQIPPE